MTSDLSQSLGQKTVRTTVTVTEKVSAQGSTVSTSPRPMTAEEYIESIRDAQEVYLKDESNAVTTQQTCQFSIEPGPVANLDCKLMGIDADLEMRFDSNAGTGIRWDLAFHQAVPSYSRTHSARRRNPLAFFRA